MGFEWDEAKRLTNFEKHALDFRDLDQMFDGRPIVTTRSPYAAEERWMTTGELASRLITVIWTTRGPNIRVISARRARDAERRAYRELYGG